MYLALTNNNVRVTTIEACKNIFNFTRNVFEKSQITNINFINDTFDNVFDSDILRNTQYNLLFLDGNHKSEKVLKYVDYFERYLANKEYILIIDDINWNRDMYKAWKTLVNNHKNCFILEFFRVGIIFSGYIRVDVN